MKLSQTWVMFAVLATGHGQDSRNLADVPCGQQWRRGSRIIGGQNAVRGEFPWLVSIRRSGGHFCGGTIVHKKWIVTAGHCMCSGTMEIPAHQLQVSLGDHQLQSDFATFISVQQVYLHPEYSCPKFVNDIALLELTHEIDWSSSVGPACLPLYDPSFSQVTTYSASPATTAGWGWKNEKPDLGNRADVLQKVDVKVVDNSLCREWYKSQGKKVNILDSQICAGDEQGGKDSCWADSGGPLMIKSTDGIVVVGVVSTGIGCGRPKLPGIYTRMSSYMPWLLNMVRD